MMTLREKFEELMGRIEEPVERFTTQGPRHDEYKSERVQFAWDVYRDGHAEGIKEAARRCAELTSATKIVISVEYPEAFTSDPPAEPPDTPPTA